MRKRETAGYLTIFLSLTLTVVISLCLTLIEGVRKNTMALEIECAADTGMNSVLAEYHRELLAEYGLFFIDTSYGTENPSYENTLNHLAEYVRINLGEENTLFSLIERDLTALHLEDAEVIGLSVASDEQGVVLRRQISAYMKERIGIAYAREIWDWLNVVGQYDLTGDWVSEQDKAAREKLDAWEQSDGKQSAEEWIPPDIPESKLQKFLQAGVLNLILDTDSLSCEAICSEEYLSRREPLRGTGLNPYVTFEDNEWDKLLLDAYILEKTGRYHHVKENSLLQYQTEYILAGEETDLSNLKSVANRLLMLRTAANVIHIMGCEEKMALVQEVSDGLAALLTVPELSPAIQVIFVTAWAAVESLYDVNLLFRGKGVPLIKTDAQWHLGLSVVTGGETDNVIWGGTGEGGLFYEDYLRIFLFLQDKQLTTMRLMDVMEMDIRLTPGNGDFRMDGCIDSLEVTLHVSSGYGQEFDITRRYGY